MSTFLITCATGRQGASTARLLLAQGAKVHALVRDPSSAAALALQSLGATLFKGDFNDVPAFTAAMQGVTGVFLNTFPDFTDPLGETRYAETFVAAARATGTVTTFVASTVFKANQYDDWTTIASEFPFLSQYYSSKAGVEKVIRASGFKYTILRPGWLMHNYIAPGPMYHFPEYMDKRVLTVSYSPDFQMEHFDADDVGKFAAAALLEPEKFNGKEIDLVYERLTFGEIAQQLSEAAGVEVAVKYRTKEETETQRKTLPTIERQVWATGLTDSPGTLDKYGIKLTTFKEFLEREKSAIKKTVGVEA
ncbi:NAD dependent epimerase/dehydratase [Mycena sp. CBHHK59/15]|nr:NAD dependent epimerase/dehydratase [Mycena sp. CBHHK59/15]